jgi:hypothetical protein
MRSMNRARPSPALAVAIIALVAALAGTAVGGVAVTALNKGEKKQVKRIAKKQGKKQAKQQIANQITSAATSGLLADIELTATDTDVASTSVTTKGNRVIAVASVEMDGDQAGVEDRGRCQISIAGVEGPGYILDVPGVGAGRGNMAVTFARELGPGTHQVAVRCRVLSGVVEVEEANLSVWATA